ncbi:type IV toxin-antitoxin system AbiEi family antitoxin domain-containing protein [Thioalkalivibrio sp. HK1]|uniref:type IV toxin-antitoxin system AbiEi family antitoxin domain-containing protein n=1 Tax=Thioalkalivibrio sp. HK1 TaxID=1469245 RepID=UPI00068426DC|nr:type IV toxin-antitoxin system AbiEi family antitoxin domain-containing protein [Thioalkalivibrio sp. HK1]
MSSISEAKESAARSGSQRDLARNLLEERGILRLAELREAGVSAATMRRMERGGEVFRLSRGIYRLSGVERDSKYDYAQAAKRVPKGVVCLVSALAFHEITIQQHEWTWMAIGNKDGAPRDSTGLRIVRFTDNRLHDDVETHVIEGVPVRVFEVSRTVVDCFRYRNKIGLGIAIEGLRWTFRRRKASPAKIACQAKKHRVWGVVQPYIYALLSDG